MKKAKKTKSNMILIYLLVLTSVVTGLSMAKYQSVYTPSASALIANWSLKINNEDITGDGTTLTNQITLVPDATENVSEGKLAPGHGGYFDIVIDPTGTEVSFDYTINVDMSQLPTDIVLAGYNIGTTGTREDSTPITDNTISGTIELENNEPFSEQDVETIRVYWMWNDIRDNDAVHTTAGISGNTYSVEVEVVVTQVI